MHATSQPSSTVDPGTNVQPRLTEGVWVQSVRVCTSDAHVFSNITVGRTVQKGSCFFYPECMENVMQLRPDVSGLVKRTASLQSQPELSEVLKWLTVELSSREICSSENVQQLTDRDRHRQVHRRHLLSSTAPSFIRDPPSLLLHLLYSCLYAYRILLKIVITRKHL